MIKELLPVVRAVDLENNESKTQWLLDKLWMLESVGFLAGPPKSAKTWLALDMAVSLASCTPCLGRYMPFKKGRVLLYSAEDSQSILKKRFDAICMKRRISLDELDIFVITAGHLRLDIEKDRIRLSHTLKSFKPDLLLLDPLVRMHNLNENNVQEVSGMLDFLRTLQREFHVAITLVHHTRKNNSSSNPGQALRGSSDLYAWFDSCLYLRRKNGRIIMTTEHRAAPATPPIELKLVEGDYPFLEATDSEVQNSNNNFENVMAILNPYEPLTRTAIREKLKMRNERLGKTLALLEKNNQIKRTNGGWLLAES